ncbi:MAG: hypothetical protein HYR72_08725 [Deltaproteobacteria bacterium]|nr:hypothetical protein [Deltaproteobacteria bacterium]MBI3388838.1 hypothetical protein [Deltaproteobacteria bacterium]
MTYEADRRTAKHQSNGTDAPPSEQQKTCDPEFIARLARGEISVAA